MLNEDVALDHKQTDFDLRVPDVMLCSSWEVARLSGTILCGDLFDRRFNRDSPRLVERLI
jgi:hypothetical protein